MAGDALAERVERLPSRLEMLVAQGDIVPTDQPACEGQDAHKAAGQHLEHVFAKCGTDLDLKTCLLTHLSSERRPMILTRIRPPARQIPFTALVQKQENATIVDDDPLHREREIAHRLVAVP